MGRGVSGRLRQNFFFLLSRPSAERPSAVTQRGVAKRSSLGAERRDLTALGAQRQSAREEENSLEGNPDLLFSFSRFCFLIRNNGRNKNAAGKSASPPYRGGRSAQGACECASRDRSRCAGGWINGSRADDNLHYDFRKLFKEAGHNGGYQPTLPNHRLAFQAPQILWESTPSHHKSKQLPRYCALLRMSRFQYLGNVGI
jgi:hypothetical protein